VSARARRLHWSVYVAGLVGAVAALVVVGPIAAAVVMLRCCSDSTGPGIGAWLVLGAVLAAVLLVAAFLAGTLASWIRRLVTG
jgi:hypothetical protein